MSKKIIFIGLTLTLILNSCGEETDRCYTQMIRLENLTNYSFESIVLYDEPWKESIVFNDVTASSITDFQSTINLNPSVTLIFIHDLDSINTYWDLPSYFIDPGPTAFFGFPSGEYTFSIMNFDSTEKKITVGLTTFDFINYDCNQ